MDDDNYEARYPETLPRCSCCERPDYNLPVCHNCDELACENCIVLCETCDEMICRECAVRWNDMHLCMEHALDAAGRVFREMLNAA